MAGIDVIIGANTDDLDAAVRRSRSRLAGLGNEMKGNIATAAKWGAAVSVAATAATAAIVAGSLKSIDALAKTSDKLGIAISDLQALRQAAELTGVGTSTLDMSLQRMTRRLSEAAQGTGEAQDALKELNLDALALAKLTPDEQFREIAGAMEEVGSQSDRVRLAFKLFDSEGAALVNTLALGKQGLQDIGDEMDALGASITRVDAGKVEDANDAMLRVATAAGAITDRLTIELAPAIEAVANQMVAEFSRGSSSLGTGMEGAVDVGLNALADFLDGVATVTDLISGNPITAQFGILGKLIFGAKGLLIGAAIGATFDLIKEGLADFGIGISEGENNARKLLDVQEEIANQQKAMAADNGIFMASSILEDRLQNLKKTEAELTKVVEGSEDSLAAYNELLTEGTDKAGGFAGMVRRQANAIRDVANAADAAAAALSNADGRGTNTPGKPEVEDETSVGLTAEEISLREEEKATLKREKMIEAFEQEKELIKDFNIQLAELRDLKEDSDTVSEDEYQQARLDKMRDFFRRQFDIQSGGLDALGDLSSKFFGAETAMAVDALGNILNAFSGNSKKIFKIQKAAGIANAIVSTFQGASKALELGWPLGPIAAASITATGFAKVAAIKSTTMAGGGSGGGGGGGGASLSSGGQGSANQSQASQPPTETMVANLNIQGQNFDRRTVIGLVEQINDLQEDGMRIRLNTV